MIEEIFKKSKAEQELIGITLYGESEFWCGIVEDYNDEFLQLRHFTKYGVLDGVAVEKISQIERIDIQDEYLKAMKIVIERREELEKGSIKTRVFEELNEDNWQFVCLKPYENDIDVLASIQINDDSFYQGYVVQINDEHLKFEIIGNSGESEGICLFKIEDISSVKINDLECRRKIMLNKEKTKANKV